jgi:hydroxymethylpyrimidine/phosphomethylpyrimidine kinase
MPPRSAFTALSISGSDSGGGTGVQADLRTFAALGVYGTCVVTAVTAQNTLEVAAIAEVPEEVVIAQIDTVVHDMGGDAVKTGMLSSTTIIQNVADRLEAWGIPHLVVDPVMVSKGGVALLQPDAVTALRHDLLPQATVITPTVAEAEVIANRQIASPAHAQEAAKMIAAMGPSTVIFGGMNAPGALPGLVLHDGAFLSLDDFDLSFGDGFGRGIFSASLTALLARGIDTLAAIALASSYTRHALQTPIILGEGDTIPNHFSALPDNVRMALEQTTR